jgi:uncharacterized protein (DUF885 family)
MTVRPPFLAAFTLACALFIGGCADKPSNPGPLAAKPDTQAVLNDWTNVWCRAHPLESVALGLHAFDGQYVVPTAATLAAYRTQLHDFAARLDAAPADLPPAGVAWEAHIAKLWVRKELWALETQRANTQNPMTYAGALDVSVYLKRDWKPWAERARDITAILRHAPDLFAAARANLDPVLPKPFIETAVEVAEGSATFLKNDVAKEIQKLPDDALRDAYTQAAGVAVDQLNAYVAWLKTDRLPRATTAFALGRTGFAEMLRTEEIDLSPKAVLAIGLAELRLEQDRFQTAAREIDPSKPAIDVFRAIQKDHPTAENLIPDTRRDLEGIRKFVVDHQLITIPGEVRASVLETLPPFRASSFASMDTPGPFEAKATEAYYYVTPVEPGWTDAQKDEWLTSFNQYTTDVVSIHEAYPGHYVQFLALNASDAGPIAKMYNSYPFVEGWAHYTELMVLDAGFPDGPVTAASTPEARRRAAMFRLAQSDEALLRLCRLCASLKMHTEGMSLADATRFFRDNCYYEEKPAYAEARRGTFDPGYCFYTLGKLQILKLRRDWQVQEGDKFSLRRFHDELLRHGAPPLRMLRTLMLHDPAQWNQIL